MGVDPELPRRRLWRRVLMMRRLLLLLVLPLFAVPVQAAFNEQERVSVKACMESLDKLGLAEIQVSYAMKGTNAQNRAALGDVIEALHRTSRGQSIACYSLLGGNIIESVQDARSNLDKPLSPEMRAFQIGLFKQHVTGSVADTLPQAIAAVSKAGGLGTLGPLPLREARRLLIESARAMQRIDKTLPYADPTPVALRPGATVPTVVGPHGSYVRTMYHLFHAHHYWLEALYENHPDPRADGGYLFIYRGAPDWTTEYFATAFYAYAEGVRQIDAAAARVAGLSEGDQFCSILKAGVLLWAARGSGFGVPEQFFTWGLSMMTVGMSITNPAAHGGPTPEALAWHVMKMRSDDSWAHASAAMVMLGFFNSPQTERCAQ